MIEQLTIEKQLEWAIGELELARIANAFICEMASKFAKREAKLRAALELIARNYDEHQTFSGTICQDIAKEALQSEYRDD